jgi:hypothetical protein
VKLFCCYLVVAARVVTAAGRVVVEEAFWREQFASTGGTAVMGSQGLESFTIDSGKLPHCACALVL